MPRTNCRGKDERSRLCVELHTLAHTLLGSTADSGIFSQCRFFSFLRCVVVTCTACSQTADTIHRQVLCDSLKLPQYGMA